MVAFTLAENEINEKYENIRSRRKPTCLETELRVSICIALDLRHKQRPQCDGGLGVRMDFGFGHGPGH
jgi:hypothetical protein